MIDPVLVVGMGQLGSVFSEAFLKLGHPVIPVLRGESIEEAVRGHDPLVVILAVGEDDLPGALAEVPPSLRGRAVLIQNELRPDQWLSYDAFRGSDPTVAIVWFEKKAGKTIHVVQPTLLSGPHAQLMARACEKCNLPARVLDGDEDSVRRQLAHGLAAKNLYILGLNLAGMKVGGTAGQLLEEHREVFEAVVSDALKLEQTLLASVGGTGPHGVEYAKIHLDEDALNEALRAAILADPAHGASGRSAPRRLERCLEHAKRLGLSLPALQKLSS